MQCTEPAIFCRTLSRIIVCVEAHCDGWMLREKTHVIQEISRALCNKVYKANHFEVQHIAFITSSESHEN